jgi:quinol monooxygenase YgiN
MSVIMTMLVKGDPARLEEYAAANQDHVRGIAERAKERGVIAHRFYGQGDTIMVIDEWPDEQSFQSFFEAEGDQIQPIMQAVGAQGEPEVTFWRKLESGDEVGWGA